MDSTNNQNIQPTVHFGNLSAKTTSAQLISLLSNVSPVLKISLRKNTDNLTAFAFVTFMSVKDAEKIIEQFNYYSLNDKQMILTLYNKEKSYPPEANVFVKNLPPKLNSKDLHEIFKMFGSIVSCKVATNEKGESKGFGFIQYKTVKAATKAINNCQNAKIGANILAVMPYDKPKKDDSVISETSTFTNVYVKNFPTSIKEDELRSILEKYGPINSLYIPISSTGKVLGYACANYEKPEDACKAVSELHNKELFESEGEDFLPPFYIQKAEKKKDRVESLKKQMTEMSLNGEVTKNNLYVSNIPESVTVEQLKQLFSSFGRITSCRLEKTNFTHQYGYVCFSTAEEAAMAHQKGDKIKIDETKINVSFYKNKFERLNEEETPSIAAVINNIRNHSEVRTKLLNSVTNALERTAHLYESYWEELDVKDASSFAKFISEFFLSHSEQNLKKLASSTYLLDKEIKKIIIGKQKDRK